VSTFEPAIAVVLKHEGGYVSDPVDPGGETNFGISSLIISREGLSSADLGLDPATAGKPGWLQAMTVDTAKALYQRLFWDRYGYSRIADQQVATKVFDAAVNIGPKRAHLKAQMVAGLQAKQLDGILGMESVGAINLVEPAKFLVQYAALLASYYRALVTERPQLSKFLSNWLRRAAWPNAV
jgi:lysozyme family protein